jgi:hypothetical protein
MSMFRRSVSKRDKYSNAQPSESPDSGALTEETIEGRLSNFCERFEHETTQVDSLRAQIEEKIVRIRNVADSRESKPENYGPVEPGSDE